MIHNYKLATGASMVLCHEHAALAGDSVESDEGRAPGARWRCRVCTIHRRLSGDLVDPISTVIDGYIVTRFPTGVIYCECLSWRFQKRPVEQRSCKHSVQAEPLLVR